MSVCARPKERVSLFLKKKTQKTKSRKGASEVRTVVSSKGNWEGRGNIAYVQKGVCFIVATVESTFLVRKAHLLAKYKTTLGIMYM